MIRDVSEAMRDVIRRATPDLGDWVELHSLSQAESSPPSGNKAALALVAVEEHSHLRNQPLVAGLAGLVRPPLALVLRYLVTYFGPHDEAQTRLARIIQAFHTTPVLRPPVLPPPLSEELESLTIRLEAPSADERSQIWGMLGRPGRLGLFYRVDVAPIAVLAGEGSVRVRAHRVEYVDLP